jgi:hypothetical protein
MASRPRNDFRNRFGIEHQIIQTPWHILSDVDSGTVGTLALVP